MTNDHDDLAAFLTLVSALSPSTVPAADAEDLQNGAAKIPSQVTEARRAGQVVRFVQNGEQSRWYWEMPDGEMIFHG